MLYTSPLEQNELKESGPVAGHSPEEPMSKSLSASLDIFDRNDFASAGRESSFNNDISAALFADAYQARVKASDRQQESARILEYSEFALERTKAKDAPSQKLSEKSAMQSNNHIYRYLEIDGLFD